MVSERPGVQASTGTGTAHPEPPPGANRDLVKQPQTRGLSVHAERTLMRWLCGLWPADHRPGSAPAIWCAAAEGVWPPVSTTRSAAGIIHGRDAW